MADNYRPRFRTQLQRPVTGQVDCGPRTWQHGIDFTSKGRRNPGIEHLRALGGRPGAQPTNVWNADETYDKLALRYSRRVGEDFSVAIDALREGKGLQICVAYGVVTDQQPSKSGDPNFRGGHSIWVQELRRRRTDGRRVVLSFDSLFDGRRAGIPRGPKWVLLSTYRRACQAFAGRAGLWWGGIVPPDRGVGGGIDAETDPELDEVFPIDPEATAIEGETLPPGSTGDDIGGVPEDEDELETVDDEEEIEMTEQRESRDKDVDVDSGGSASRETSGILRDTETTIDEGPELEVSRERETETVTETEPEAE